MTRRIEKQNTRLQKQLSDRDTANQTRQYIFDFYNSFCAELNYIAQSHSNVAEIFTSFQSFYGWSLKLENIRDDMFRSVNTAKLMIDDEVLICIMRNARDAFSKLYNTVNAYINTGIPVQTVENAWEQVSKKYNINKNDYYTLVQNKVWHDDFVKMCENSYTKDIDNKIQEYIDIVGNDSFDTAFKKHAKINELKN